MGGDDFKGSGKSFFHRASWVWLITDLLQSALPTKKIDQHSCQDDDQHSAGHGGSHVRIRRLKLIAEKRAEEKRPENIRSEIGSSQSALGSVDELESVEVADKRQH